MTMHIFFMCKKLVRPTGQQDCLIDIAEHCDPPTGPGGIGCHLRYQHETGRQGGAALTLAAWKISTESGT